MPDALTPSRPKRRASVKEQGGRVPPFDLAAEQAALGACLVDEEAALRLVPLVPDAAFYDGRHDAVMGAVRGLVQQGVRPDLLAVQQRLREHGALERAGGPYYLTELTTLVASAENAEHYGRIVLERWMKRRFIETASLLVSQAYDPATDAFELLAEATRDVAAIDDDVARVAGGPVPLENSVDPYLQTLLDGRPPAISSGLRALDGLLGGGHLRGRFYVYAGRPAMGKSGFGLGLTLASARAGYLSAYFSVEMPSEEVHDRIVSQISAVSVGDVPHYARLHEEDQRRILDAADRMRRLPLHLDATAGLGLDDLVARMRRLQSLAVREGRELGVIAVDYLQLVVGRRLAGAPRTEEVASITRTLKALAKELHTPIVALSQVARRVEERADKRPTMADLAESSSIENDADAVGFLYRPEYYGETVDNEGRSTEGVAEIVLAKHRGGATGSRRLAFLGARTMFANLALPQDDRASAPF